MTAWKKYPDVESELLNVHGLNNKISLFVDARSAYSNQQAQQYRRPGRPRRQYLRIRTPVYGPHPIHGGHLADALRPAAPDRAADVIADHRHDRRASVDQHGADGYPPAASDQARAQVGKRRIVDYMTLDATTTYFPTANRDNFGTPWGQAMYNYQWYIGDRTSIVSQGWFDFFKLVGSTPLPSVTGYNPNGLNIITTGISIARPPRSNVFLGYTIIDTGPIKTSAINASVSYWLSPKWYGTFSQSYDFGDAVSLGTMFAFTRIGADYLTTIGLAVDPQRGSFQYRLSDHPASGSRNGLRYVGKHGRYAVCSHAVT